MLNTRSRSVFPSRQSQPQPKEAKPLAKSVTPFGLHSQASNTECGFCFFSGLRGLRRPAHRAGRPYTPTLKWSLPNEGKPGTSSNKAPTAHAGEGGVRRGAATRENTGLNGCCAQSRLGTETMIAVLTSVPAHRDAAAVGTSSQPSWTSRARPRRSHAHNFGGLSGLPVS
jgi:hypothetical protein